MISTKIKKGIFACIALMIVILLFTIIDHFIHGLESYWGVPDYYFRNKIPFGFLWGIVGLFLVYKLKISNIWLKALTVSGIIAVTLQVRYFIEGYSLGFVLIFLLFHFLILYLLLVVMFKVFSNYLKNI